MQHFNCPHCKKQIDVFDAGEAEREKLRLDSQAKKRAERITLIQDSLNKIPGVFAPLEYDNIFNEEYFKEKIINVFDENDGIIRYFKKAEVFEVFTHLVNKFREMIKPYSRKKFLRPYIPNLDNIICLPVNIDNYEARIIMSYHFMNGGYIVTIDTVLMPSWMDNPSML